MVCDMEKGAIPGTSRGSARKEEAAQVSEVTCVISDKEGVFDSITSTVTGKKRPRSSKESDQRRAYRKGRRTLSPDEDSSPPRRSKKLPTGIELADELRKQPTPDLGVKILAQMALVTKVAMTSSHLKGIYIRDLKVAALTLSAAATEMAKRLATTNTQQIKEEKLQLRGKVADLKQALAAAKAVLGPSLKEKRRKTLSSSMDRKTGKGGRNGGKEPKEDSAAAWRSTERGHRTKTAQTSRFSSNVRPPPTSVRYVWRPSSMLSWGEWRESWSP